MANEDDPRENRGKCFQITEYLRVSKYSLETNGDQWMP